MALSTLAARGQVSLLVNVEAMHTLGQTTDGSSHGHRAVVPGLGERDIPGHSRISLQDYDGSPFL